MKEKLAIAFFFLALFSGLLWVGGWVAVAAFSWMDGDLAKRLGMIGACAAVGGEAFLWIFGGLFQVASEKSRRERILRPVGKKYGHKPSAQE